jgi:chromosome segregation ATPase
LLPLTQAVENAQKALAAARRDAGSADAQVAQAKAKIAALNNEKKTVEKKIEDLTAKREVAAKAAEAAKAASKAETKPVP